MNARATVCLLASVLAVGRPSPAFALANRVFVSARSGNNANACDNVNTPCQTFAGAVTQLNPDGEVIVLDSGGYGPVTITQGVTIEAPAGVTAFIHPPSGNAITVNAGVSDKVTLRGLTLNVGPLDGILVTSVGTLSVENCTITGFSTSGIRMNTAGLLSVTGTVVKDCDFGVMVPDTSGTVHATLDHCHLEGNFYGFYVSTSGKLLASIDHCHLNGNVYGYYASTVFPGSSATTATYSTANHNSGFGWICGGGGNGKDVLNLEACTGSENATDGLNAHSTNALSAVRYSGCAFTNNGGHGVSLGNAGAAETRGNNTLTGNAAGPTSGSPTSFSPL